MAVVPTVPSPALYVGDLHPDVTDSHLFDLFSSVGAVTSVRVCRDTVSGRSLGYGYVNYISSQDASQAIKKMNHASLNGKPIRIMWSHRHPDARNSGIGNLFVKNLSDSIDSMRLHKMFGKFGNILSYKVVTMQDGKSKGYGFVQFDSEECANSAIEKLNGSIIDGKKIYVGNFIKKSERTLPDSEPKYTNLYMKNLDDDITVELIQLKFSEFGKIKNVVIAKDAEGNSKGFGFVNFENPDNARRAMEAMNGAQLASKTLYVGRAQKKEERQEILRHLFEEKREKQLRKNMASNVYVKNIDDDVDEYALREHFSQCGNILSAKVMHDDKGISKGFGFVCYSKPEEASKAVNTLHGCMFHRKPLYVAIAQRKEDRKAQLQPQFAQHMVGLAGSLSTVIPAGYPLYYSAPGVVSQIPPRQGLMYQTLGPRPGWRPSGFVSASRPPFQPTKLPVFPNSQRQHRQSRGQMNGHMLSQSGQSIPHIPHLQQPDRSLGPLKDFNSHQRSGQMKYAPNEHQHEMDNSLMVPSAASNSQEMEILSSMLGAATPQQQKQILGEHLFPLVQKHKPDLAAKITGMLLEMDNSELLLLLESPESLAAKVEEAVQVLKLSKAKLGGPENSHGNYLSAEVAVN
ncbi:polyadenylate-binding protein 7-like [Phoenix dactylifera]|uniref:Polyadenylate-binding protein n=1 Tax=Phoenix dactylifera TaxID=42345 RepID=A0A8B7BJT8_PHODC|nr:polyadenylate-binding protein 7-like [Phoenix dactylifera]